MRGRGSASLVQGVVASIRGCLAQAGVTVHVDVPDDVPEILGDRPRLEQVIQEILTNSLEAGARAVWVSGRADAAGGEIRLAFEDDGRGLAPSAAARAFDLFFTTKPLGTGVGLTAVRRIVQEHGGAVSIAASPGRRRRGRPAPSCGPSRRRRRMTPRILIVEDEGVLAQSIQRSLEREGHEVAAEKSAEAGLDALAAFDADLVLLDLLLPGMGGLDFLRTIREQGHEMPVIAMSAHGAVRIAVEAMRQGAYDYVTKPLDLQELKILVARALDHARLSRELTYLREREQREAPLVLLLGECPEMQEVRGQIERVARMERQSGAGAPPVLILGETGTGKGLAARSIHRASSRSASPFIDVHCAGARRGRAVRPGQGDVRRRARRSPGAA